MENNEKLDWKPEVGGKAWIVFGENVYEAIVSRKNESSYEQWYMSNSTDQKKHGFGWMDTRDVFPTAEAAYNSFVSGIKIYDLEGKEVQIPRASVENLEAPIKLSKEREMELLNLAIAYGDADYQQKDGADRAWHHVATAREKLIAFVENREPELDDEY